MHGFVICVIAMYHLWLICKANITSHSVLPRDVLFSFLLSFFFKRLAQRISQTAGGNRKVPTDPQSGMRGTIQVYISFPKFCSLFELFQVEWKTHIVSFLENYSTNSRIVCGLQSTCSSSTKKVRHESLLTHNLVSIFQMRNVSPGKTDKINFEYVRQHLTDFHLKFSQKWLQCVWSSNSYMR